MSMSDFADHVISISKQHGGGITNLQLQKVMYFTLGRYINLHGVDHLIREIYDEPFEAWPYGPVVRSEYFRNRPFGRYNIMRDGTEHERYNVLNEFIIEYINIPITDLVEESHKHSTWIDNKGAILRHERVEYSFEDLVNDFANH